METLRLLSLSWTILCAVSLGSYAEVLMPTESFECFLEASSAQKFDSRTSSAFQLESSFSLPQLGDAILYRSVVAAPDGSLYLLSMDGFRIDKVHVKTGEHKSRTIGKGLGPGEFGTAALQIGLVGDLLFVHTMDRWVHVFDADLKYVGREFVKTHLLEIFRLNNGHYLVHGMSYEWLDKYRSVYFVAQYEDGGSFHARLEEASAFVGPNTITNLSLSKYVVDVGPQWVAVGQEGSRVVQFYNHGGKLVKELTVEEKDREMHYVNLQDRTPALLRDMLKKINITDFRSPLGGYLNAVRVSDSYSLIQAGLTFENRLQSAMLVRHIDWKTRRENLPPSCGLFDVTVDRLYCLVSDAKGAKAIQTYTIRFDD